MHLSKYFILLIITSLLSCHQTMEVSQWRGPDRDGKYPDTNLLKEWPEEGPKLVWAFEGLGAGHGNVGIGNEKLFVCGMPDTLGILYALDMKGNLLWQQVYGEEWHKDYVGPRSTPTVVGDLVYLESGQGIVYCYDAESGKLEWTVDLLKKFNAENIQWGMAESLLIRDRIIFCTPGGKDNNVVALNRFTGETIWTSPGNHQPAAYCSPIYINHESTKLLVTVTAESIIGLNPDTGEFYWSVEQQQGNKIHANTPVFINDMIICSSDYSKSDHSGTVLLELSDHGKKAKVKWRKKEITNLMGGFIVNDGYIFGSPYNKSEWYCLDIETGEPAYISKDLQSGTIIYADGLYYCYTHRGEFALVDANQNDFKIISHFKVPLGTNQHWAHPVIDNGILYVRHGDALMAYHISKNP